MTDYLNQKDGFKPIKVGKKGKLFELLVARIEDAKKKNPNIIVRQDVNLESKEGNKRQFDALIESELNEYKITIAIESKEYTNPVGVDKLGEFKSKCDSVNQVDKMIFTSISGYSKPAIKYAEANGIELVNISDLTSDDVFSWTLPMKFYLQKRFVLLKTCIARNGVHGEHITSPKSHQITFKGDPFEDTVHGLCVNYVVNQPRGEWESHFKGVSDKTQKKEISYVIFPKSQMSISCKHKTEDYEDLIFKADIWEELIELQKSSTKEYKKMSSKNADAKFIQLKGKTETQKVEGEIIISPDKPIITVNVNLIENGEIVALDSTSFNILSKICEEE